MQAYQKYRQNRKDLMDWGTFVSHSTFGGMLVVLCLFWPQTGNCAGLFKVHTGSTAVPDPILESMRGGFSIGSANFNFTFRSLTWVNNVLQAQTELTLANNVISSVKNIATTLTMPNTPVTTNPVPKNTSVLTSSPAPTSHPTPTTSNLPLSSLSTLIQIGPGNSGVSGNALSHSNALTTVIQNNVSNAMIQHLTQVNGVVSNVGATTHAATMVIRMNQVSTMGSILSRF